MPGKLTRSAVFGLAGFWPGKMLWMRRQPDLRMSVIVKLAKALQLRPETFFRMILFEETREETRPQRLKSYKRVQATRRLAGSIRS